MSVLVLLDIQGIWLPFVADYQCNGPDDNAESAGCLSKALLCLRSNPSMMLGEAC